MTLTPAQRAEFDKLTEPLMKWLNDNCHPHVTVVINPTRSELHEGVYASATTDKFVKA